jgi:predicted nucleic acid-binding protein
MSQSKYPSPVPTGEIIKRLHDAASTPYHEFWPDDLSILDQAVIDNARIHGPKQVTDVYLLALAVKHAGRFATFDDGIPLSAVLRAEEEHLAVI